MPSAIDEPAHSRAFVARRLRAVLPGQNLYELAPFYGVTVYRDGKLNKGWAGQTIERAALLAGGNSQSRDGVDFELKSTSLVWKKEGWEPKETIKITQLTPDAILSEAFETSALWMKLSSLVLVGLHHESPTVCTVARVRAVDITEPALVSEIKANWEEIRLTVAMGEIGHMSSAGTSGELLQLRPTGTVRTYSTCPITGERVRAQAFYATKRLLRVLFT